MLGCYDFVKKKKNKYIKRLTTKPSISCIVSTGRMEADSHLPELPAWSPMAGRSDNYTFIQCQEPGFPSVSGDFNCAQVIAKTFRRAIIKIHLLAL